MRGVRSVEAAVAACGPAEDGRVQVHVVVRGATGTVQSATVHGRFAGTATGACVEREVATATFARFAAPDVSFNMPFQLRGLPEPASAGSDQPLVPY